MTAPLGNPFALGATGVPTTARTDRLALGASFRPGAAALAAASGFLVGPAGTMGDLTLLTDVLLRVDPFLAVVQGTHNTQQGQYLVPNVQQRDLAVAAKDASLFRKALVQVRVADSLEAGVASSASTDGSWLEVKLGALAASNPALPALDANSLAVGELSIPSTASGQPVTLVKYNPRTGSRGGILPVVATDTALPAFDGQYRDHPDLGLQRGKAGAWTPASPLGMPACFVRQQFGSGVYPPGWGAIAFDVADVDTHGMFSPATPTSKLRLTVTAGQGGVYEVSGTIIWAPVGVASSFNTRITKNGLAVPGGTGGMSHTWGASNGGYGQGTGVKQITLAAGDYVSLEMFQSVNSTTAVFSDAACVLSARRIR